MKAAVYRQYHKDPRQVVKIEDIDTPNPKGNEVLIKVDAQHTTIMISGAFGVNQSRFLCLTYQEATSQGQLLKLARMSRLISRREIE